MRARYEHATGILVLALCIVVCWPNLTNARNTDSQSTEVYRCDFGEESDQNYDNWPDGWTRRKAPGYPNYIQIEIQEYKQNTKSNTALLIQLDGAAAFLATPKFPILPHYSYSLEADVRLTGIQHDEVTFQVNFLNEQGESLEKHETPHIHPTGEWQNVRLGGLSLIQNQAKFAQISLHVKPGEQEDLHGKIWVDNVRLVRYPQVHVQILPEQAFYRPDEPIEIYPNISGIEAEGTQLELELRNALGETLERTQITLGKSEGSLNSIQSWKPEIPGTGYYYAYAIIRTRNGDKLERFTPFAVLHATVPPRNGEFGWNLPANFAFEDATLLSLMREAGLNWAKLTVSYAEKDIAAADRVAYLADELDQFAYKIVGVIDTPKNANALPSMLDQKPPIAMLFAEKNSWTPMLDTYLSRLSLKIRWWQLGTDDDTSFVGDPLLVAKRKEIREQLNRYGESLQYGFGWKATYLSPVNEQPREDFIVINESPVLTAAEIRARGLVSDATRSQNWLAIQPLSAEKYTSTARIRDLMERMVAAKQCAYPHIFVPHPINADSGLVTPQGKPTDLYLPWRTLTHALAGAEFLGSLRMSQGSENYIFGIGNQAIMVIWNDVPCEEQFFLGEQLTSMNAWGKTSDVTNIQNGKELQQVLAVGTIPQIIYGIDPTLAQWCMSFQLETSTLLSLLGREQMVACSFKNASKRAISGSFRMNAPDLIDNATPPVLFTVGAGEKETQKFPLYLKPEVGIGPRNVKIDFELNTDKQYRFSVYRPINIGLEGIEVDMESRLLESGDLEVKVKMANATNEKLSFQCQLFAPMRRRMRGTIHNLESDRQSLTFLIANGKELLGQPLRLRIEELGGYRVLNHQVLAHE